MSDDPGQLLRTKRRKSARLHLLLIAIVFFGPLIVAAFMYYGGAFNPTGRTNHGALLEPIVNLSEELPGSAVIEAGRGHWVLIYSNPAACDTGCRDALYTIRQSRRMLGRETERLRRVFLHGESLPDTVFLAEEHAGLISLQDNELSSLLNNKKPASLQPGGYFLLDPLGNLVMYFEPDIDPSDMVEDIEHLLRLSRIG